MSGELAKRAAKWKSDPVLFISEVLRDPETGKLFELYPVQVRFLREALTPTADGRLPFGDGGAVRRDLPRRPLCGGLLRSSRGQSALCVDNDLLPIC